MKQPVSRKIKGVKVKPRPVNNNTYNPKTGRITYGSNYEFDSNEDRDAFFNTYWNDAEKATTGSLIKPETLLSQAYVETLGGRNMPKNNMFGLTARKPEENPERYNVGIYETHEYFDTPDYYKTIDINGETFIDDEYKDKKLYGTELVTEGKNEGRYKYKVDRYFREYESIEEGMKGYIDNFSETSAYKSSMEELNSKPEDQKSFLKGISSSYSTSLGYDSPVIKNYDYFNKKADKRRMKNKLLYTDANIADNVLKFKDGGFPYGNVEAEGRELVLRNSHGDMAIIPKKYRQEALDMIKEGCDGCLDNLISTLPKVKDYAKDGTVFGIPPNTFTAPSSTIQSANQNVNSNLIGKTREDIPQYNPGQTFIGPDNRTDYERQRNQEAMNAYQNPGFVGSLLSGARMVTRAVADPIQGVGQVFDAVGLGNTRIGQDLGNFNDEEAQYRYRNLNPNIDAGEKFMSNLGEGSEVAAYGATNFIPFESSVINPIVKGLVGKGNYSSYLANQLYSPVVNQGVKEVVEGSVVKQVDDVAYPVTRTTPNSGYTFKTISPNKEKIAIHESNKYHDVMWVAKNDIDNFFINNKIDVSKLPESKLVGSEVGYDWILPEGITHDMLNEFARLHHGKPITQEMRNIAKAIKEANPNVKFSGTSHELHGIASNIHPDYLGKIGQGLSNVDKAGSKVLSKTDDIFKSEIDWSKWNKEIPNNKSLIEEYNAIEETTKANSTWMKNPDGSDFDGTPEQFIQQLSTNFQKSFPTILRDIKGNIQKTYHGSPNTFTEFDPSVRVTGRTKGEGYYTSPKKDFAENYAKKGDKKLYEFYQNKGKKQDVLETFNKKADERFAKFLKENPKDSKNFDKKFKKFMEKEDEIFNNSLSDDDFKLLKDFDFYVASPEEYVSSFKNLPKSAIGNNGMFDMTNPNIYKSIISAVGTAGAIGVSQDK